MTCKKAVYSSVAGFTLGLSYQLNLFISIICPPSPEARAMIASGMVSINADTGRVLTVSGQAGNPYRDFGGLAFRHCDNLHACVPVLGGNFHRGKRG